MRFIKVLAAAVLLASTAYAQQQPSKSDPHCQMAAAKTTHHFQLAAKGGSIEVAANDPADTQSRDEIRMHLSHIASMFADGNFNTPMFIHDTNPPGVPTMTKLRAQIHYQYEETPTGGRVRILTDNDQALDAVHAFLLFQIIEHRTGDSANITD
jgi:hypothetical protein